MSTFNDLIVDVLKNPPDPNEPLPLANQKRTIVGIVLTFLIVSWIAVLFRLWVRIKVVRNPGLDDVFVVLSAVCNIAGTIWVYRSVEHGLGRHMLYIGLPDLRKYLFYFYLENSIYLTQTGLIKISLLLQFLRIFKAGAMRWICIFLLVLVTIWGMGFAFVGWFPCFPIRGVWDRQVEAKCYGFGFKNVDEFVAIYKGHAASNMILDIAIFLTPLVIFKNPQLKPKHLMAMAGVFAFGAVVVSTSVWRLYAIWNNQAGTYPYVDFTWWAPAMIILSSLEINLAIVCASIPIFWPIIEQSIAAIFVSVEVNVIEERLDDDYELGYPKDRKLGKMRSIGGTSVEELTKGSRGEMKVSQYSIGLDPLDEQGRIRVGPQASIHSKPKPKWEL
ncbi:hypothetical protein GQ44DRAFT_607487 [Phaeosphaeriaceae sp. PMI808]|nr:hypothetical protein GQ44DRAFT_607487 [Phaeosphaeriaceae sp. PMI808]